MGEWGAMSEVRSSELETWLSSSDSPVEMEEDTASPFLERSGLSRPSGRRAV